jgi:type I restriction enzyme R subunit
MSEYTHVERPFLDQLAELGWEVIDQGCGHIPSDPVASLRSSFREVILPEVFREAMRAINLTDGGEAWLTDRQLDELRDQIFRQQAVGLLEANEVAHGLLHKAQVDRNEATGEVDPVVRLVDFEHPERNRFHAINQFRVDTPGAVKRCIIPDIVLFVNGLPLVVVEAKIGDATTANPMYAAYEQLLRYRDGRAETAAAGLREGEPELFVTNLLLVRTCGERAEFGTITSGPEHFHAWRIGDSEDRRAGARRSQERLIEGLLTPAVLLNVLGCCTVFMDTDSGARVKVVCRYQQYRAARRIVERLRTGTTPTERSGVVWHTQGSGKSLTMVFAARMLRASADLNDFKIVLVCDRVDLEQQLSRTAALIGGRVHVINSSEELRRQLSTAASDLNMAMIHKFMDRAPELPAMVAEVVAPYADPPSGETFGVVNASDRILVMIDEAHRTQSSDLGDNLFQAFPNAARIAFTGTPLITEQHGERRTARRFGEYIDTYKLMDAVADNTTLQILYEGRTADTALRDRAAFDDAFEDLFANRTAEELEAIKRKYGATGDILEAEQRIGAIARDLVEHYVGTILPDGFKAQVVCHSKLSAVRYRDAIRRALAEREARERRRDDPDLELIRWLRFLKVAVVVSADHTNEPAQITQARREAREWDAVTNFCRPFAIDEPGQALTGTAFLVVCDMLLTGFDAPIEQVMYIDKKLREHTLLQAIARVNRVAPGKRRGFIVDYIGLANNLADALTIYSGEDWEDLTGGLKDLRSELPILEERYRRLVHHFSAAGVRDIEAFAQGGLADRAAEMAVVHAAVTAMKDEKQRAEFEIFLKRFLHSLNVVLPDASGHPFRVPAKRFGYLLRMVKERYKDESLDLADAGAKVKALINQHLVEQGIDPKIPPVALLADDFVERVREHGGHVGGSAEAKASEMEHAIRRHCTVHFQEDPAFYKRLSDKLERLIRQYHDNWEALAEEYVKLRDVALAGRTETHEGLSREESVFYDLLAGMAFEGAVMDEDVGARLRELAAAVVRTIREEIGLYGFWDRPVDVRRLQGAVGTEILLADIPELAEQYERVTVEIMTLARNRHGELVR